MRRLRESAEVEARVHHLENAEELERELAGAGNNLVVLEVGLPAGV